MPTIVEMVNATRLDCVPFAIVLNKNGSIGVHNADGRELGRLVRSPVAGSARLAPLPGG